jgi:hypothetical protein
MVSADIENANPSVYETLESRPLSKTDFDNNFVDLIDEREVFDEIRNIKDPEHPLTLEQLNVVDIESVKVDSNLKVVTVQVIFIIFRAYCSLS